MAKLRKRLTNSLIIPLLARFGSSVHVLHIAKTGGTALRAGLAPDRIGRRRTPSHNLYFRNHSVHLADIPAGQKVIFGLRDPAARFVSAFYSRMRGGQFGRERDKPAEQLAFQRFATPNDLATALSAPDAETRAEAEAAMASIIHIRVHIADWLGTPADLEQRAADVLYVFQQETLNADFETLKTLLDLPQAFALPREDKAAHRLPQGYDRGLSAEAEANIARWYARDYALIEACRRLFKGDGRMR